MKKYFSSNEILPVVLIIFASIIGFIAYPCLPQQVPSHWDAYGVIDAWMNKNLAVIFFPALILVVYLFMAFIPFADPFKKNYLKFIGHYFWFRTTTVIFLILLYFFSLWAAFGAEFNIIYFIIPLISFFFIYTGFFLPHVKRNYFVGIRTPWTLYSEKVWDKTHEFAGKVFIFTGILCLLSVLSMTYAFIIFLIIVLAAVCVCLSYAYWIFKTIEGKK